MHGNRYDYSKVLYIAAKRNVAIICPEHGEFKQLPPNHYIGHGCHECGGNKPLTLDRFIKRAHKAHKGRYDYSRVELQNVESKVEIICPDHGSFLQRPASHLKGFGCGRCGRVETAQKLGHSHERFLEDARRAHGDRYDYSQVEYVNALSKPGKHRRGPVIAGSGVGDEGRYRHERLEDAALRASPYLFRSAPRSRRRGFTGPCGFRPRSSSPRRTSFARPPFS